MTDPNGIEVDAQEALMATDRRAATPSGPFKNQPEFCNHELEFMRYLSGPTLDDLVRTKASIERCPGCGRGHQNGQEFEIAIDAYDTVPTEGEK
jgi:hypothetical protein